MSYFLLPSKPVRPKREASHLFDGSPYSTNVDLGGVEPPSEQFILGHAKISFADIHLTNHAIVYII